MSRSHVSEPRFELSPPDENGLSTWLTSIRIAAFDQEDSPACWAATVCRAIHAYLSIYGNTFTATSLAFSPQCLINCIACIIREKVIVNWYPNDECYAYGTLQALCFSAKYGIASLTEYPYTGKMRACRKYDPIVAPIYFTSLKMYEKSASEKPKPGEVVKKTKGEREKEKLQIGFDQHMIDEAISDNTEVASDEKVIEYLRRSPMLGTFQCFDDYPEYKGGERVYFGPPVHMLDAEEPTYHAVVVTGYKWFSFQGEKTLVLQVHTSNDDFGPGAVGYISRHLFIAMESIQLVSPRVEVSEDILWIPEPEEEERSEEEEQTIMN